VDSGQHTSQAPAACSSVLVTAVARAYDTGTGGLSSRSDLA
jgi:hypothetical protein